MLDQKIKKAKTQNPKAKIQKYKLKIKKYLAFLAFKLSSMSFSKIYRSFKHAWRGLVYTFRYELSFKIQTVFAAITLIASFYFPLKSSERIVIILLVALVLILELVNSVLERILDLFRPRINESSKFIKDIMAGAVLLAAIVALVLGLTIFLPYIRARFNF